MNLDYRSRREQRNFGLLMAVAIPVLGLVREGIHWFKTGDLAIPLPYFIVGAAFLVVAVAVPKLLQPLLYLWIKLAMTLNWLMTRVMLSVVFYLMITPGRFFIHLFAQDPLKRDWRAETDSFWETPEEAPREFDRYRDQF